MKPRNWTFRDGSRSPLFCCIDALFPSLLLIFLTTGSVSLADGCFVFRWNKAVDINEPTQKAIIVYDRGREDLLLQVKYEGPLEDFGWLIPVPSLPEVEKGSMEPFYELSQFTQRQFGPKTLGLGSRGAVDGESDRVKIIEVKTIGAYEVAVLSPKASGGLRHWLESNGYSLPSENNGVVDEYIRMGWYFVAARIQLDRGLAFKLVSTASPKDEQAQTHARQDLQKQVSSGELHPLRISFDSPRCIFPLRISAVAGKPSEVSLYVLSPEPLLNKFLFDGRLSKWRQAKIEYDSKAEQRQQNVRSSMLNMRRLNLACRMYSLSSPAEKGARMTRDWSLEDLDLMAAEGELAEPFASPDQDYYPSVAEFLQTMPVPAEKIPKCVREMDRLSRKSWHLTKLVYKFQPEEMQDLEFQPAIPILAALLPLPEGRAAAGPLFQCGPAVVPVLLTSCKSTNSTERSNASLLLQSFKDEKLVEPLLRLLKDPLADVRLNAVMATTANWDQRFNDALFSLLRDPQPQVRWHAAYCLTFHESTNATPRYLDLLRDPDPGVASGALHVLAKIDPTAVPRTELLRLLGLPRMDVVSQSLSLLQGDQSVLPSGPGTRVQAMPRRNPQSNGLSSPEAAPLTTNQLILARLTGLRILYQNGDATAVALSLPLLRDTNSIVRNRAFALLRSKTNQDFPQADPAKWEAWWDENKTTFEPR